MGSGTPRIAATLGTALLFGALLSGCGVPATSPADADSSTAAEPSETASPSVACPDQFEGEAPQGCLVYDPDEQMDSNERYRDRMDVPDDVAAAGEALLPDVIEALEELRLAGPPTEGGVSATLESLGLAAAQTRSSASAVAFGVVAPDGGCVFGVVDAETVTAEFDGYIMDGGCLPAQ